MSKKVLLYKINKLLKLKKISIEKENNHRLNAQREEAKEENISEKIDKARKRKEEKKKRNRQLDLLFVITEVTNQLNEQIQQISLSIKKANNNIKTINFENSKHANKTKLNKEEIDKLNRKIHKDAITMIPKRNFMNKKDHYMNQQIL